MTLPTPSRLDLEVEELLSNLPERASTFCELVAAGLPAAEAYGRAGFSDGNPHELLERFDVRAAISALRERAFGNHATDKRQLRLLLLQAVYMAHADGDHRGVVNAVRALAELDEHIKRPEEPVGGRVQVLVVNTGLPPRGSARGELGDHYPTKVAVEVPVIASEPLIHSTSQSSDDDEASRGNSRG